MKQRRPPPARCLSLFLASVRASPPVISAPHLSVPASCRFAFGCLQSPLCEHVCCRFRIRKEVRATAVPASIRYLKSLNDNDQRKCYSPAAGGCDEMFCPCIGTLTKCRL